MSALTDLLGIELPIIQAPMAGVQGSALAIAVSNAGGLGSLPCALLSPEAMRSELQTITDASRGSNLEFLLTLVRSRRAQGIEPQLVRQPGSRHDNQPIAIGMRTDALVI